MDKLCSQCQKAFEAKRADARYCSSSCNKAHARKIISDTGAVVLSDNTISDNPKEIISDKYAFKAIPGQCHGCNTPNDPRECICCTCIAKGRTHKSLEVECKDYEESVK